VALEVQIARTAGDRW